MKSILAATAGFLAFMVTWIILGKALLGLFFPVMFAQYGNELSGVMALGCVVALISVVVSEGIKRGVSK
jgi:hypothetical protein